MLTYHPSTPDDAKFVGERLRSIDTIEAGISLGLGPVAAVSKCRELSDISWTIKDDGVPLCLFGVAPYLPPQVGTLWMLGTDYFTEHRKDILREVPTVMQMCHTVYPTLVIEVAHINVKSQRFLKWIGFKHYALLDDDAHPTLNFVRTA